MIKKRRWGKEQKRQSGASHMLKIGFDAGDGNSPFFGKLPGFCVFRSSLNKSGKYPVDYSLTRRLMLSNMQREPEAKRDYLKALKAVGIEASEAEAFSETAMNNAIVAVLMKQKECSRDPKVEFAAPEGILPRTVEFVLANNAKRNASGEWTFPGLYDDQYQAFKVGGCKGCFCRGDGEWASRWQPDGTRKRIPCVPMGRADIDDPEEFCEYSKPTVKEKNGRQFPQPPACSADCWLTVMLGVRDDDNQLVPLSPTFDARFEFSTKGEDAQEVIGRTLERAAERLDGQIAALTGTLSYQYKTRMLPHDVPGTNKPVQQVGFQLNEFQVQSMERQRYEALGMAPVRQSLQLETSAPALPPASVPRQAAAPIAPEPHAEPVWEPADDDDGEYHFEEPGQEEPQTLPAPSELEPNAPHDLLYQAVMVWDACVREAARAGVDPEAVLGKFSEYESPHNGKAYAMTSQSELADAASRESKMISVIYGKMKKEGLLLTATEEPAENEPATAESKAPAKATADDPTDAEILARIKRFVETVSKEEGADNNEGRADIIERLVWFEDNGKRHAPKQLNWYMGGSGDSVPKRRAALRSIHERLIVEEPVRY